MIRIERSFPFLSAAYFFPSLQHYDTLFNMHLGVQQIDTLAQFNTKIGRYFGVEYRYQRISSSLNRRSVYRDHCPLL